MAHDNSNHRTNARDKTPWWRRVMSDIVRDIRAGLISLGLAMGVLSALRTLGVMESSMSPDTYFSLAVLVLLVGLVDHILTNFKNTRTIVIVMRSLRPTRKDYLRWAMVPLSVAAIAATGTWVMLLYRAEIVASQNAPVIWAAIVAGDFVVMLTVYKLLNVIWCTQRIIGLQKYHDAAAAMLDHLAERAQEIVGAQRAGSRGDGEPGDDAPAGMTEPPIRRGPRLH